MSNKLFFDTISNHLKESILMTALDLLISTYEDLYDKYFEQLKKDHPNIRFNEVSHSRFWEFNSLIAVVQEFQTICSEEVRQLFDTLIADVPEIRMTKPVVISIDKMNDAEIQILENVFCRLNVTHLHREPQKYLVYCTEADFEHLKKSIIDEFYKVVKEKNIYSSFKFIDDCFPINIYSGHVSGCVDELRKVVKSKR